MKRVRLHRWQVKITKTATAELSAADFDQLLAFYRQTYEITPEGLERSVKGRSTLYRVYERATGRMVGSAAYGVVRVELPGGRRAVVFNGGDIVLLPEARGLGLLQEMGLTGVLRELKRDPWSPKYLLSVALTYKLYRAVSRMFVDYWPRFDSEVPPEILALMEEAGRRVYGDAWRGATGVVDTGRRGHQGTLAVPEADLDDCVVRFFAERNPTHLEGTALPIMMPLDARNLAAVLRSLVAGAPGARRASTA